MELEYKEEFANKINKITNKEHFYNDFYFDNLVSAIEDTCGIVELNYILKYFKEYSERYNNV